MWRLTVLARHALITVASELGRTSVIVAFLTCILGGVMFIDLDLAHRLKWEEGERISNGLNVVIAKAPGAIDSALCEELAGHTGFRQAGSLRESGLKILASDRSTLVPTGTVSTGMLLLLGYTRLATLEESGVVLGESLAHDQALFPGGYVDFVGHDPHKVLGTIPESGRSTRVSGWGISVELTRRAADECWVETEPGLRDNGEAVMRSLLGVGQPLDVTTLIDLDDRSGDLVARYRSRIPLSLRWPIVLVLALIAALTVFARRAEYGLCRALNMRRSHVLFITQIEWFVYTFLAFILGFSAAIIGTFFLWTQRGDVSIFWGIDSALMDVAIPYAASVVVAPLVATIWQTDISSALKDR